MSMRAASDRVNVDAAETNDPFVRMTDCRSQGNSLRPLTNCAVDAPVTIETLC